MQETTGSARLFELALEVDRQVDALVDGPPAEGVENPFRVNSTKWLIVEAFAFLSRGSRWVTAKDIKKHLALTSLPYGPPVKEEVIRRTLASAFPKRLKKTTAYSLS